jgi:hypothetical protein
VKFFLLGVDYARNKLFHRRTFFGAGIADTWLLLERLSANGKPVPIAREAYRISRGVIVGSGKAGVGMIIKW